VHAANDCGRNHELALHTRGPRLLDVCRRLRTGLALLADAAYVVALCANLACTAAAQYDVYCDSGTALACPDAYLEAGAKPASGCVPSFIGDWSSGEELPGPLYCCP
jgi:hypothetical protein